MYDIQFINNLYAEKNLIFMWDYLQSKIIRKIIRKYITT